MEKYLFLLNTYSPYILFKLTFTRTIIKISKKADINYINIIFIQHQYSIIINT